MPKLKKFFFSISTNVRWYLSVGKKHIELNKMKSQHKVLSQIPTYNRLRKGTLYL